MKRDGSIEAQVNLLREASGPRRVLSLRPPASEDFELGQRRRWARAPKARKVAGCAPSPRRAIPVRPGPELSKSHRSQCCGALLRRTRPPSRRTGRQPLGKAGDGGSANAQVGQGPAACAGNVRNRTPSLPLILASSASTSWEKGPCPRHVPRSSSALSRRYRPSTTRS
jgi:hypothetical protein